MRIAFVGKGGSGKTTLSSLFVQYLRSQNQRVLVIDADINQHLALSLGFTEQEIAKLPSLGNNFSEVKSFFVGTNPRQRNISEVIRTSPPGKGSRLIAPFEENVLYTKFSLKRDEDLRLMMTGVMEEEELGVKCYHGKVGGAEMVLSHMVDEQEEYVVCDMTAGADPFSTGLFAKFDLTIIVVEPTQKSLDVYRQYVAHAAEFNIELAVVGNKIMNADDEAFIRQYVGDHYLGSIGFSQYVRAKERGEMRTFAECEPENIRTLEQIKQKLDAQPHDLGKLHALTVLIHERTAKSRGGETEMLLAHTDPEFTFPSSRS